MNIRGFLPRHTFSGNFREFELVRRETAMIYLIIGKRGSGKTVVGFRMLEDLSQLKKKQAELALEFNQKRRELPNHGSQEKGILGQHYKDLISKLNQREHVETSDYKVL